MMDFAELFIKLYSVKKGTINLNSTERSRLNELLTNFIHNAAGYHINNKYDISFLMNYFTSFFHHIKDSNDIVKQLEEYIYSYYNVLNTHPYSNYFIDVIEWIYSNNYDGKLGDSILARTSNLILDINDKSLSINNTTHNPLLPNIFINDIDEFEMVLQSYINTIKDSQTLYNIFNKAEFDCYENDQKIKMIFEGTILNATLHDLYNIEDFFKKYTSFVNDSILSSLINLQHVGTNFNDDIFFKVLKSDFEYETPYALSYMLKNTRYEFPNVRVGIDLTNGTPKADVIATQTSQRTGEKNEVSSIIKSNVPKISQYRYYKPNHFVSLLMSFGLFNGMGINEISVQTFMPLRYYKTIKDKKMNEEEANQYLSRMIDKNKNTYYRLLHLAKNLEMSEDNNKMNFIIDSKHKIEWISDYLNSIYDQFYTYGEKIKTKD